MGYLTRGILIHGLLWGGRLSRLASPTWDSPTCSSKSSWDSASAALTSKRRGPPPLPLASAAAAAPGTTDAGAFQWGVAKAIAEAGASLRGEAQRRTATRSSFPVC